MANEDAKTIRIPSLEPRDEVQALLVGAGLLGFVALAEFLTGAILLAAITGVACLVAGGGAYVLSSPRSVVIGPAGFVRDGPFGGPLPTAGGLRWMGCVGEPCVLSLGDAALARFAAGDWAQATELGSRIAAVSGVGIRDDRIGDFEAWSTAGDTLREVIRLEALTAMGLGGRVVAPVQPTVLEADQEQLVVEVGGMPLVSTRDVFWMDGKAYPVQPSMRVRVVPERAAGRWSVRVWCTAGGTTHGTESLQVDDRGLAELVWFAEHLERSAVSRRGQGSVDDVPVELRSLRRGGSTEA